MTKRFQAIVAASSLAATLSGCLLGDRPAPPRLFTPVVSARTARLGAGAVRIKPVRAPLHLREGIAWRRSEAELGIYEQRRWTELPATFVERALDDALAADGIETTGRGEVPVLSVELRQFEEVLSPTHEAVIELAVEFVAHEQVANERIVWERRFSARQPVPDDDPATFARAMGLALDEVATAVSRTVRDATRAIPHRQR